MSVRKRPFRDQTCSALPMDKAAAVWFFNMLPSLYMHTGWRQRLVDQPWCYTLFSSAIEQGELSKHILRQIGIEHNVWLDWDGPEASIALYTDSAAFLRLADYLGHVLLAQHVRRAIGREERLAWHTALGEQRYDFLCKQAALKIGDGLSQGFANVEVTPASFTTRAPVIGLHVLIAACEQLPTALGRRLLLKLPPLAMLSRIDRPVLTQHSEIWPWIQRMWRELQLQSSR